MQKQIDEEKRTEEQTDIDYYRCRISRRDFTVYNLDVVSRIEAAFKLGYDMCKNTLGYDIKSKRKDFDDFKSMREDLITNQGENSKDHSEQK